MRTGPFFCFQAEDGIRDLYVTGVQTCALPISTRRHGAVSESGPSTPCKPFSSSWGQTLREDTETSQMPDQLSLIKRSEERRVGKESRTRSPPEHTLQNVRTSCVTTSRSCGACP